MGDSSAFHNSANLGQPSTSPVKYSLSPLLPSSISNIDETMAYSCDVDVDLTNTQLLTRSVEACKVKCNYFISNSPMFSTMYYTNFHQDNKVAA